MLAQGFWDPAKSCSHAVLALFLFSNTGQKRQAGPCSSSLGNILRTTKRRGVPWGQHDRPSGTPPPPHTHSSVMLNTAHLSVRLFPFLLMNPQKGRTHLTCLTRTAPPAPAFPTASQQTYSLYHPPASSAPLRAGVVFDLLPDFPLTIVHLGEEYFKQEMITFLFVYVKSEDFHTEERSRVAFGSLPKSYKISPAELSLHMKKQAFIAPSDPNPVNTCTCT